MHLAKTVLDALSCGCFRPGADVPLGSVAFLARRPVGGSLLRERPVIDRLAGAKAMRRWPDEQGLPGRETARFFAETVNESQKVWFARVRHVTFRSACFSIA